MTPRRHILAAAAALSAMTGVAGADVPVPPPVAIVAAARLPVGSGELPVSVSPDWSRPLPQIRRAVVIVHGYERNAADYARWIEALAPAGTLIVAPQFLAVEDIAAHRLPGSVLRWSRGAWSGGWPAEGPAPLSAFDALDALLARLGSRATLPNLSQVVLAGFSAGGQLVQRYAVVGNGEAALPQGVSLRYVVASPSSYVYFSDARPQADGALGAFAGAADCPQYGRWKYGFAGELPPYVAAALHDGPPALEQHYARRDVVYLLGAADTDPHHRFLDQSCAAEAEGPTRLARGIAYFRAMQTRDGAILNQKLAEVPGAAHNARKVFDSPCGRAALFGEAGCTSLR